ncbi:HET domain-containing protein [Decorospora gaudefroyi]|uniref:HET domain-containing protein n=1 Tax=Decorospora gaudefroyi TaxID=184978 RepID=A0A6A5K1N8_9PLEO|nr:HET domain-containing protein [Decorospora gaudefroyi]
MKCNICNKFQGKWPIFSRTHREKQKVKGNRNIIVPNFTWEQMLDSSKACYGCRIILSGCRGSFALHDINESNISRCSLHFYYPLHLEDVDDADADKYLKFRLKDGQRFEVELFAVEDANYPIPESWDVIPTLKRTSPRTDSAVALATIKGWIAGCVVDHCTPNSLCDTPERQQLPTRVVDVGQRDGVVKVVETKGARANYICLSHCWGLEQIITTTKSTLQQRMRGIDWDDLSKTFQDAIGLTRALGFEYIWIDSLCIIQDDVQDWNIESARMASVYSNGHVTIAATHSPNGRGGLYTHTPDYAVSGTTPNGEPYCLFFRERIDHQIDAGPETPDMIATETYYPLLSRAWVYQERMLSTRVLHFGRYELFFECKSSIDCECGTIQNHGAGQETPIPLIKIEYADNLSDYDVSSDEAALLPVRYQSARLWRTMVSCYTVLHLTKSKDRLPAIGGLARQLATRRQSKYLAGLWEDSLQDDLLWEVYTASKLKRPRPYPLNAPTWSWASVENFVGYSDFILFTDLDGPVAEEREPVEYFSTVERCTVHKSGVDDFGSIAHGQLVITGRVVEAVLEHQVRTQDDGEVIVDYYASFPGYKLPVASDYLLNYEGPGVTSPGTTVFFLRMALLQLGRVERLISLVLRRSPDILDAFERIGSASLSIRTGSVDARREIFDTAELRTVVIV